MVLLDPENPVLSAPWALPIRPNPVSKKLSNGDVQRIKPLKLAIPSVDLNDVQDYYRAKTVIYGAAILASYPAFPNYLLRETKEMYKPSNSYKSDPDSEDAHKVAANRVLRDPNRLTINVLFKLPEGTHCSGVMDSMDPPLLEQDVGFGFFPEYKGTAAQDTTVEQSHHTLGFLVHIVSSEAEIVTKKSDDNVNRLAEAFKGGMSLL